MIFYKVQRDTRVLIKNELITRKEIETTGFDVDKLLIEEIIKPVEISKKKTHWSFGVRFEDKAGEI